MTTSRRWDFARRRPCLACSGAAIGGMANGSRYGLLLLLIPLPPDVPAGGVEPEQDLEFRVGLIQVAQAELAADQQRPGISQLRVQPDRLAAGRHHPGPILRLGASPREGQEIIRPPG